MSSKKKSPADRVVRSRADLLSQGIRRPSLAAKPQNVLLALDRSSSMSGGPVSSAIAAADDVAAVLADPKERDAFNVGLVTFNHEARYDVPFIGAHAFSVPPLTADGGTDFACATERALRALEAGPKSEISARSCLLFLTDGLHEASSNAFQHVEALHRVADVVCVGLGPRADLGFLAKLASRPDFVTTASTGLELRAYFVSVAKSLSASRASGGLTSAGVDPFASRRL